MDDGVTVEQILADMERFIDAPEEILPGDVSVSDICRHFHCAKEKARAIMQKMEATGEYRMLRAGPARRLILRKITG